MLTRVFIDSRVNDKEILISLFASGTEYSVLDANRDGIEQMVAALAGQGRYDSLQIISHGAPGSVTIGSTVLDNSSLGSYAAQLSQIGSALTETGDLLIYGCNVAQSRQGKNFVEQIADLTGAFVIASTTMTGAFDLGGDWILDACCRPNCEMPSWSSAFPEISVQSRPPCASGKACVRRHIVVALSLHAAREFQPGKRGNHCGVVGRVGDGGQMQCNTFFIAGLFHGFSERRVGAHASGNRDRHDVPASCSGDALFDQYTDNGRLN